MWPKLATLYLTGAGAQRQYREVLIREAPTQLNRKPIETGIPA